MRGPGPLPAVVPEVAWRAGVDLDPVDVREEDRVRWLATLVFRLAHLEGALPV